jgi:hypothetical protein
MSEPLRAAVARQRMLLRGRLASLLERLAHACAGAWPERAALEQHLLEALPGLPSCKYLYVLDAQARQLTANCTPSGLPP